MEIVRKRIEQTGTECWPAPKWCAVSVYRYLLQCS